jgi:protein-tyrosine phosphatase
MLSILFVCTANICRSPMASGLFKSILEDKAGSTEWQVGSAGTWALSGEPAALGSQTAMRAKGIDISDHRARGVSRDLLESADLVLTMERGQKESLHAEFPDLAERIHLLSEVVSQVVDVDDPYGGTLSEYEEAAAFIEHYLTEGFEQIEYLANLLSEDSH